MPKATAKSKKPKLSPIVPNKGIPAKPTTLAEWYRHTYTALFNKLSKEEQSALLANLAKKEEIIRGEPVQYSNVRSFIKAVAAQAEESFDKQPKPQSIAAP